MIPLLLAALQQPAPPEPAVEEDIVVVAQRMSKVRWTYNAEDGKLLRCTIKRPSGSATVDRIVCEASRQCAEENPSTGDRHLAPCIKDRVRLLFADWQAERLAAQGPRQP